MTPPDVSAEALRWLGTSFHWQGRSVAGLDCLGLPVAVAEALRLVSDVEIPRYRPPLPGGVMVDGFRRYLIERKHATPKGCRGSDIECCNECRTQLAGTVVVIGRSGLHCGIVTDDGRVVTVMDGKGCIAMDLAPPVLRLIRHVFEFPGVVYS